MLRNNLSETDLELIEHKGPNQNINDIILGNDHPSKFAPSIYNFFSKETKSAIEYQANKTSYIPVSRVGK